jgi:hypothetical protein
MDLLRKVCGVVGTVCAGALLLSLATRAAAQVSVTTWGNDIGRTGQNLNETILAPSNVNSNQFGKLFSHSVDGYVYAQPLYLPDITISGTSHNVVFAATEHDTVYAFDADSNSGTNSNPLWSASMLSTAHGAASGATTISSNILGTDIIPEIGITGTPVIDSISGTLYVVSATQEGTNTFVQRLHALDVTTGAEKFGGPVVITASVPGTGNGSVGGTLTFDSEWQSNRAGLLLLNGIVYVAFGSHGDNGPWHGWVIGYNEQTLKQTGAFCASPNGTGAGIWMSGTGLAAEVVDPVNHPYGRMFVATGNGDFTATKPFTSAMDYGDSIIDLDLTNGVPTVVDDFTPFNQANLDQFDTDQGSGGVVLLPTQTTGNNPHLLVEAGKSGTVYLLNRDNLGGYNPGGDQVVQAMQYGVGNIGAWSSPAYWNGMVYYWGQIAAMQVYPLTNGQLVNPPRTTSETYKYPGANPSISANGNSNGIVWSIESDGYQTGGSQVLQAHDASNPATTLYSSSTNSSRDNPGGAVKYAVPTVANGKVYIGSQTQLSVFGLLNGTPTASAPVLNPGSQNFSASLQVTITDSTPGATIYYSTDGSTPTISSPVYSGPLTFAATTTVKTMATATNFLESPITTATYTQSNQVATPSITPAGGTYSTAQTVTISDSTPGATIYYTTNGSTPTTSSTKYTGAITVSTSETITAMAAETGYNNSRLTLAVFTINTGGTTLINFGTNGFSAASLSVNNGASVISGDLQLTDGGSGENRSAWYSTPVPIGSFVTDFSFQQSSAAADGMTFTIQNSNIWALGYGGSGLGYQSISKSVAIKFDIYNNSGEGSDSTGIYLNGAAPTLPATDLSSTGITLLSGDIMHAHLVYDGINLTLTLTDTTTNANTTKVFPVNISSTVGGNTAYVGFTGGTGGLTSIQRVLSWSFGPPSQSTAATPTITPAGGTYSTSQTATISDLTAGATIYYTTNGSTPTTSSTVYSSPITISSSETLQAIAVASGYSNSSVASAVFTIAPVLPSPTFAPAAGTYTSTQSVTISDVTPGTTIYYTTDGTLPTTSSPVYSGPITVSSTQTIQALAVESGFTPSSVSNSTYTLQTGISFPTGFSGTQGNVMIFNGSTGLNDTRLQLTNGAANEAASAWYYQPVNIQSFTTDFSFQLSNPAADGITFAIQGNGVNALGSSGAGLGYQGIGNSIAIKFDFYNDAGEGADSTGLYTGGATPTLPAIDLSNTGIDLRSGDTMNIHLVYDGTTLSMSIYDIVTGEGYSTSWPVNIPSLVGGNTAYLGFTGGTNALSASQKILTWTYAPGSTTAPVANSPAFNPPGGTYSTAPTVTLSDSTTGATIYYTTDGSTPTAASHMYSAPVAMTSGQTLKAMAAASGHSNSTIATATYTTGSTLPTPAFSPAAGTYSTAQTVTINESTGGATIYYTTDGSAPTQSSNIYSAPISVSATETIKAIAVETGNVNSVIGSAAYTISTVVAPPSISPAAGTYTTAQTVTISDSTTGATIYYTTNGTTPTTSSAIYAGPITVSSSETIEAMAAETGFTSSPVTSVTYTINPVLPAPTFAPGAGTYTSTQTVTISDTTSGTTIYYTTNGTTPTTSSTKYTGPVAVSTSETLEAIAVETGYTNSPVATAAYTINQALPAPTFAPGAGTYTSTQTVTISDTTSGTTVYYTTNGTTPTTSSTKYTSAVTVSTSETLEAIAVKNGNTNSPVASAVYTINPVLPAPTFSPGAGTYTSTQTVTISDTTSGTTIYYTTNGTTPTTSSTKYTGPVAVSTSETLEAIAVETGYTNSPVATAVYTITPVLPTPTFLPAPGTYASTQSVVISDAPGAAIYYTTDGSAPSSSSPLFNGAIAVSSSETLKAIAIETGYANSPVAIGIYTISSGSTTYINYPSNGFTAGNLSLNYGAAVTSGLLQLTNGGASQNRSAWFINPVPVNAFTTDFTFQQLNASADGMTFTIQNSNIWALGYNGGGLGYQSIPTSVAIKFDLYDNAGEGNDSTGIYTNGIVPTLPSTDLTSTGVNLHSGDTMHAHIVYDGTNLTLTLTDTVTNATTTKVFPINIPSVVGGSNAYVGFTGSTGGMSATQNVLSWTYITP